MRDLRTAAGVGSRSVSGLFARWADCTTPLGAQRGRSPRHLCRGGSRRADRAKVGGPHPSAVVSLRSLYDVTGRKGPYHPCIEALREDRSIVAFRRWLTDKSGSFSNRELKDIEEEIDAKVTAFTTAALDANVGRRSLESVAVDLVKDRVGSALGVPFRLLEYIRGLGEARDEVAHAFIGKARLRQPKRRETSEIDGAGIALDCGQEG